MQETHKKQTTPLLVKPNNKPNKVLAKQVKVDTPIPNLSHPHRLIFCGRSGKGKTYSMVSMLNDPKFFRGFFNRIYLFSPSAQTDPKFLLLKLDPETVFTSVTQIEILKMMKRCITERNLAIKKGLPIPKYLCLFDDCGAESEMRGHIYANPVDLLTFNCRWLGISKWLGVQNINSLSVPVRTNANGVLSWDPETKLQTDTLYQNYGCFEPKEFKKIIKHATKEERQFLFINRNTPHTTYMKGFNTNLRIRHNGEEVSTPVEEKEQELKRKDNKRKANAL